MRPNNFVAFFLVFSFAGQCFSISLGKLHGKYIETDHTRHDGYWDYFMLVTEWPQSSCEEQQSIHEHDCVIPDKVEGWILHGLWPSASNGSYPQYCHNWKFDWDKIQDLDSELEANWPNLYADTSKTSFWKHEYEKHGTCAADVKEFGTEHDFFEQTLLLKRKYDPYKILNAHHISPDNDKLYQASDIKDALTSAYQVKTCVECQKVKDIGTVLMGAYICLDKSLKLIDCMHCEHTCNDDDHIYYHPLKKSSKQQIGKNQYFISKINATKILSSQILL